MENHIKVLTPFYNAGQFLEKCLSSILTQKKHENFQVILVNDASTDNSDEICKEFAENYPSKILYIKNEQRKTALENLHDAIINHCKPDDLCILVDGDDYLINNKVFEFINNIFNETGAWFIYGQCNWTKPNPINGYKGIAQPYASKEEFDNMRELPFHVSHIRMFRAGVYHCIKDQDPTYSCMKDKNGEFYKMTYDVAICHVICELCGFDKVRYNDVPLYVYNRDNPISDDRVDQGLQYRIHMEINSKPKFKKIENYK